MFRFISLKIKRFFCAHKDRKIVYCFDYRKSVVVVKVECGNCGKELIPFSEEYIYARNGFDDFFKGTSDENI